ncbi:MAG: aminotransferase class III-fold pyridoxal phosphate-dependent enzyme [Bifidobacteriaceae bacterium]|jgi:4-aminobutyrate aminotransferase-like enzyme|nr:aminotransferase class III-fold pyridoxal phosphate-dependent enzyme [Bifidobacteriaceae bacterium]
MATGSTVLDANAFNPATAAGLDPETADLARRRAALLGPAYRLFYKQPVHVVRGEGARLFDPQGNAYLDVYNNVASVGHCNPRVVAAVQQQVAQLNTHTRYLHGAILDYAEQLLATLPPPLDRAMFMCTGSEANDLAVRVAQAYTHHKGVIITREAYHGNTDLVSGLSPALGAAQPLGDGVRTVPAPDAYRLEPGQDLGRVFAGHVQAAIDSLASDGLGVAALLVDSAFSSDGVHPDPAGFLAPAVAAVRAAGGVLIADEVQPGFTRTGATFWGFMRHGLVPELVTMGKPMGNGIPISALVAQAEVLDAFATKLPYFNTFGGNPVSIAAAQAVLDEIQQTGLQRHVCEVGAEFLRALRDVAGRYDVIGDVRGAGLYLGVEIVQPGGGKLPDAARALAIVDGLRARRVLTSVCGAGGNVLKLRPPLVFGLPEMDWFMTEFEAVLQGLA